MAAKNEVVPMPYQPKVFIVAIEYAGERVPAGGASRRPLLEHAWEVHSGLMPAHLQLVPRVAFPDPIRGWPVISGLARCQQCDAMIAAVLRRIISDALIPLRHRVRTVVSSMRRPMLQVYPVVVT